MDPGGLKLRPDPQHKFVDSEKVEDTLTPLATIISAMMMLTIMFSSLTPVAIMQCCGSQYPE